MLLYNMTNADEQVKTNNYYFHHFSVYRFKENFEVGQNTVTAITINAQLPEPSVLILNWYKQIMYVIPSDVDDFIG